MILYHGSNVKVETPIIKENLRLLDFGGGFYLTSNKEQAIKWSKSVSKKRGGSPVVNEYTFDQDKITLLKVLQFDSPNIEWLDFVVQNRKGLVSKNEYDLVIGPVANDSTLEVINDYMSGRFTKKIAIELLLPQKLSDQYAFLTSKSLELLDFMGSF